MNSFALIIVFTTAVLLVEGRVLPRASTRCGDFSLLTLANGQELCYRVETRHRNWIEAEAACRDKNVHLVSIHDYQTNEALLKTALGEGIIGGLHIGLSFDWGKGHFTWSDGSIVDYSNYGPGLPNLAVGSCVAIHTLTGTWLSIDCSAQPLTSICVRPTSTSSFPIDS